MSKQEILDKKRTMGILMVLTERYIAELEDKLAAAKDQLEKYKKEVAG